MNQVAYIKPEQCDKSPACPAMRLCPQKAISQKGGGGFFGGGISVVDKTKCTGCGVCMRYCPKRAISMQSI